MKATCLLVRSLAPSSEGAPTAARLRAHVEQCLSCQAELARYNRLRRELRSLADVVEPAPPQVAGVERAINAGDEDPTPPKRGHHVGRAAAGGAVAAAAAGAAAVVVWRHSKAAV